MDDGLSRLREALLAADEEAALAATRWLLDAGVEPTAILEHALSRGMTELGERWNRGEAFLPEVVAAADIFKLASDLIEPALASRGRKKQGPVAVMGTVKGDLHDLGKNIVSALLRTGGFEVKDLGRDVPAEKFVEATRQYRPAILGLSALLTTTMTEQKAVIEAVTAAGLRSSVKIMVGGAPVTSDWASRIGADAYAANAPQAVEVALALVKGDARPKTGGRADV